MTDPTSEIRTVVLEREFAHKPEKLWRALTQPHLIEEWLMANDFAPAVGHKFRFTADWGGVDCEVREIEPNKTLSYTWDAYGLESIVTWTLTPTGAGTHVRLEQTGFRPDQDQAFYGAQAGWQNFLNQLDATLGKEA